MHLRTLAMALVICLIWWWSALPHVMAHYDAWLEESRFVYNPMVSGSLLVVESPENLEVLVRTFPPPYSRVHSIQESGRYKISFAIHAVRNDDRVWGVYREKMASARTDSPEWKTLSNALRSQAIEIRHARQNAQIEAYLTKDIITLAGPPMILLLIINLRRLRNELFTTTSKHHFPDV